jgi:hypothetical protein
MLGLFFKFSTNLKLKSYFSVFFNDKGILSLINYMISLV